MERLFGLTYVEIRAFLRALDSIYNITELMSGDFVLGVDQALSKSLTWFEVDLYFSSIAVFEIIEEEKIKYLN